MSNGKWPPDPSPQPDPPKLHKPTPDEIKHVKDDAAKGVIHGSEERPHGTHTMDQLLPEKPAVKDGFVELGNLKVQADKYKEFRDSMMHESKNPEMNGVVESLEKGPYKTTVKMNASNRDDTTPLAPGNAEVSWDPSRMNIAGNDAKRSPATRLAHELDHAEHYTHDPQQHMILRAAKDRDFANLEEKRVITGSERRNVHAIGEGERTSHHTGKGDFEVKSVTSTTPVLHQTRDGVTTEVPASYSQTGKISVTDDKVVQDIGRGKTVEYGRKEFEGLVGKDAVAAAAHDGKPMTVSVADGEFKMSEARTPAREVDHAHR